MPVGSPIGRSTPGGMGSGPGSGGRNNVPGGLAISSTDKDNDGDGPGDDEGREDDSSGRGHQRRASNASDVAGADKSPTQSHRKTGSPPRIPTAMGQPPPAAAHYPSPYGSLGNVALDPAMYAHHPSHYMPGQGGGAGAGGSYMGGGAPAPGGQGSHWQSTAGQAGYGRR